MEPSYRRAFNAAFGPEMYADFLRRFEQRAGCPIPFRVAETPLFVPAALRDSLERAATEIVEQISSPALIEQMKGAIPPRFFVPGMDPLPNCVQVDFAIVRGPSGELEGKVVELQAFNGLGRAKFAAVGWMCWVVPLLIAEIFLHWKSVAPHKVAVAQRAVSAKA